MDGSQDSHGASSGLAIATKHAMEPSPQGQSRRAHLLALGQSRGKGGHEVEVNDLQSSDKQVVAVAAEALAEEAAGAHAPADGHEAMPNALLDIMSKGAKVSLPPNQAVDVLGRFNMIKAGATLSDDGRFLSSHSVFTVPTSVANQVRGPKRCRCMCVYPNGVSILSYMCTHDRACRL